MVVSQTHGAMTMIARHNRFGCLYYSFPFCSALGPKTSPPNAESSDESHRIWNEALGDMLRSMSEFLMLATSRSPIQWMMEQLSADLPADGGGRTRTQRGSH